MDDDAFVTVAVFQSMTEAVVAQSMLENHGIASYSPALVQARILGGPPRWLHEFELRVAARDAELAGELLGVAGAVAESGEAP